MNLLSVIMIFVLAMIFYGVAEYASKMFGLSVLGWKWFWISIACYMFTSFLWFPFFLYSKSLTIAGSIWCITYTFVTLFMGFVIFQEQISTLQMWGVVLGLVSLILLLFG